MMVIIPMCLNSGLSSEDASAVLLPIVSSSALSAGSACANSLSRAAISCSAVAAPSISAPESSPESVAKPWFSSLKMRWPRPSS
ncbi:hypothetical protein ABIA00_006552 [Bradyrhizobium ottawaense]